MYIMVINKIWPLWQEGWYSYMGGLGGLPRNWLAAGLSSGHMTDVDKCFKRVDVYFTTLRKPCF